MNQKEIWLVVNPTVGLPLFLGAVAATALIVHASILNHTDWFSAYWQGSAKSAAVGATTSSVAPIASAGSVQPVLVVGASDPQATLVASAAASAK
jgi:light-harvesting protein B-800-850 alpha chain